MMKVLVSLSLWFVLLMWTCCGSVGSHEEELTSTEYPFSTATPDYDYNSTFEYFYFYYGNETDRLENKAAGIGRLTPVLLLGLAVHQIWN